MKISVIIPTYNRAKLLQKAINSVLEQTYMDYEIIVVSDGSTDETENMMREFEKQDRRIRYISYYPSVNGSHARNIGIKAAKGEYIAFLDDDDIWLKEKLEKQIKVFNNNPEVGLVTSGIYYVYVNEEITYKSIPNAEGDVSRKILISNCIGGTQAMVRKDILDKIGGFDEALKALQDYDLWIRVCQITKVATVKEPCINYYNYRGNRQVSQVTKNYENSFEHISEKYSELIAKLSDEEKRRRQNAICFLLANKAMRNNDKKIAYKYIFEALKKRISVKALVFMILALFDYKLMLKTRKRFRM